MFNLITRDFPSQGKINTEFVKYAFCNTPLMWATDLQVVFTFLLISLSSSWICEALRSCWCLRKRLLAASNSCNSLFMAANLETSEQLTVLLTLFFVPINKLWRCGASFYFVFCSLSFCSSFARRFLRCSSAFCSTSCVELNSGHFTSITLFYVLIKCMRQDYILTQP